MLNKSLIYLFSSFATAHKQILFNFLFLLRNIERNNVKSFNIIIDCFLNLMDIVVNKDLHFIIYFNYFIFFKFLINK